MTDVYKRADTHTWFSDTLSQWRARIFFAFLSEYFGDSFISDLKYLFMLKETWIDLFPWASLICEAMVLKHLSWNVFFNWLSSSLSLQKNVVFEEFCCDGWVNVGWSPFIKLWGKTHNLHMMIRRQHQRYNCWKNYNSEPWIQGRPPRPHPNRLASEKKYRKSCSTFEHKL